MKLHTHQTSYGPVACVAQLLQPVRHRGNTYECGHCFPDATQADDGRLLVHFRTVTGGLCPDSMALPQEAWRWTQYDVGNARQRVLRGMVNPKLHTREPMEFVTRIALVDPHHCLITGHVDMPVGTVCIRHSTGQWAPTSCTLGQATCSWHTATNRGVRWVVLDTLVPPISKVPPRGTGRRGITL